MQSGPRTRLAVLRLMSSAPGFGGAIKRHQFESWVEPMYEPLALSRNRAIGHPTEVVEESEVSFE